MAVLLGATFAFVALVYLIVLSVILGGAYRLLIAAPIRRLGWHIRQLSPGPGDQLSFRGAAVTPQDPHQRK
jgi:hypothetical protein